jgi:alpha-glucosidase
VYRFHKLAVVCLAVGAGSIALAQAPITTLTSPDGRLTMTFGIHLDQHSTMDNGRLVYSLKFSGKQILDDSGLSLDLDGAEPLGEHVHIADSQAREGVDDFKLANAKTSSVHESYHSLALQLEESSAPNRHFTVEARAYNDGIAFRYLISQQDAIQKIRLRGEKTEFRLTTDATTWALELPNYRSSYESEYVKLPTTAFSNQGGVSSNFLIGLPLLMHAPGAAWMALMEADIEGNSSMYVTNPSGNWAGHWFVSKLSPRFDTPELAVESTTPWHSPWRVLLVADNPGRLLESTTVYALNPPSHIDDTSWIHPGKSSWNWWVNDVDAHGTPAYTTENMKRYVDFAAQSGFPYMLLDAGWSSGDITKLNGKVDIPELARYAATKGVKIWIWLYSGSVMKQMHEAFPLYEKWGVAGIKIDFVNRDDQQGVQFYYDVAEEAAKDHLMVDFHGTRTPWGIERTWPNVLSYEGVLGLENNKVGRRDSPVDRTVFAFTRALAGPMDYTPGAFDNATEDGFVARNSSPMAMGTRAQQLALYVVFPTPFQMVSDSPEAYAGQPAFQFIKDVPVTWDETRVLNGEPGEFATIARRHGQGWYVGSITNWTPRDIILPLSFLGSSTYTAQIYEDGKSAATDPKQVEIREQPVTRSESLRIHLAPGGGFAIRIIPRKDR